MRQEDHFLSKVEQAIVFLAGLWGAHSHHLDPSR